MNEWNPDTQSTILDAIGTPKETKKNDICKLNQADFDNSATRISVSPQKHNICWKPRLRRVH